MRSEKESWRESHGGTEDIAKARGGGGNGSSQDESGWISSMERERHTWDKGLKDELGEGQVWDPAAGVAPFQSLPVLSPGVGLSFVTSPALHLNLNVMQLLWGARTWLWPQKPKNPNDLTWWCSDSANDFNSLGNWSLFPVQLNHFSRALPVQSSSEQP